MIAHLDFERSIACAPDRLWTVLTDATHRETWGAPSDDAVLIVDASDTRVGGLDRHRCGPKDNPEFTVETRWYRLAAPEEACFTETLIMGEDAVATSLVTYRVTPDREGSRLVVEVAVVGFDGAEVADDFRAGWSSALDRLTGYVLTQTESETLR